MLTQEMLTQEMLHQEILTQEMLHQEILTQEIRLLTRNRYRIR